MVLANQSLPTSCLDSLVKKWIHDPSQLNARAEHKRSVLSGRSYDRSVAALAKSTMWRARPLQAGVAVF